MTKTHLFDLPLLWVRNLGESLALQGVILIQLRGVAKIQVAWTVRVPHGDLLPSIWAYVSPPVGVQILTRLLVHILANKKSRRQLNIHDLIMLNLINQ